MQTLIPIAVICTCFSLVLQPRIQVHVDAVRVDVLVTRHHQPWPGLTADDFELRDNGVPQVISRCETRDTPLDITLVFDTSASVARGSLDDLKGAAKTVIRELRPGDRAGLVTFSHKVDLVTPLTADRRMLEAGVDRIVASGATALFDAVVAAILAQTSDPGRRSLMIVYTDGADTVSWLAPGDAVDVAAHTDSVVYVVAPKGKVSESARARFGPLTMSSAIARLTGSTGGRLVTAESDKLTKAFASIVSEFTNRYQLWFYPEGVEPQGWHTLTVTLRGSNTPLQARRGYYAGPRRGRFP